MKKPKHFLTWIAGALLMLISIGSWAVNPTYTAILGVRTQPSCNTFEFDVMLKRTGTVAFELAQFQMGILMNPNLVNGGVITVTPVANSSTLSNQSQVPGPEKFSYDPVKNCIIVTPVAPPGTGNGSIILSTGLGTKFIRIRVMNSVPWPAEATNASWNFTAATGYVTKMFAYVSGLNTDITTSATHTIATTMNNAVALITGMAAPAAQTLTGDGGTYCDLVGATGAPVGLAASVNGIAYELIKNSIPTGMIIYGRTAGVGGPNSDISWGNQTEGVYTAQAYVCGTGPFPTSATILPPLTPAVASVFITTDQPGGNVIPVPGTAVVFTANPDAYSAAQPGTTFEWFVNGVSAGVFDFFFDYTPVDGDVIDVDMTADPAACVAPNVVSGTMTMVVGVSNPPLAFNVTGGGSYCAGSGGLPVGLDGSEVGVTYTLFKNTIAQVPTVDGTGAAISFGNQLFGTYTVSGTNGGGTTPMTGSAVITEDPALPVSVSIVADANPVCAGTSVTFTATPVNGGTPAYQWFLNGAPVGAGLSTYSTVPATGDQVHVVMTSSLTCVSNNPATSNTITMTVNALLPVSVSIVADANPVCAGTSVTFTATPVNGGTPAYQWFLNGAPVGAGLATYSVVPVNGDQVHVVMTSSLTCVSGNPATSNTVTMTVNPLLPVSVSIVADANPVCAGTSVTFTATPVNGGTPAYQWFLNGAPVGAGLSTYSTVPANGDQVHVVMTSSLTCVSGNPATSNTITMTVNPLLPVSVSIVADANPVCAGTSVTFTATPVNGGTPAYQWFLNGAPVGAGLSTYSTVPATGDQVHVVMTSSLTCVSGNPATSNTVTMTVNTLLPVGVSIVADANPVCAGTLVTFTATPVNGGTPAYQWFLNGAPVGAGLATYSVVPTDGDHVHVVMTSNLTCVSNNPATSNDVAMIVNPLLPVSVSIVADANPVCAGTSVTFTATPVNGGTPAYQWFLNGAPVGAGLSTYSTVPANGDQVHVVMTSSLTCVSGNPATSNTVTMTVNPLVPVSVSIVASANPVFTGNPVTFTATPVNGGAPAYQWYVNGGPVGAGLATFTYIPANGDQVHVVMTSSLTCVSGNPATSNTINMVVNSPANAVWTGNVSNDWNNAGNWDTGIPGSLTNVVIPAGLNLYPTLASGGTCHNIFFGSTAAGTATLLDNGMLAITGTATVQRYFSGLDLDWHLVSSPVSSATAGVFTGMYLQSFGEASNSYTEITSSLTPLNVMEGYGLYSTLAASNTATFTGNLNLGTKSHIFTASGLGWNLLGNPFVSSVDWEAVTIPPGMSNEVHYIEASTGNDLSYVKGTGGTGSQYIPPMQGFFVSAISPETLFLGDAQRSHAGANTFYKSDNPKLLILEAAGTNYSDQAWIHFNDQAGVEHDGIYDAYKRISTSNPELPQIYSVTPSGTKLSVNGLPETSTVPVGFTSVQSGDFTIRAVQTGQFAYVSLEDLFNKTFTDLLANSYSFTYTAGDQDNRFVVHFKPLSVDGNEADVIKVYSNHKDVYISVPANRQGSVKIFNMLGQPVAKAKIVDVLTKLTIDQTSVYTVQVTINDKIYTKKVIIRE